MQVYPIFLTGLAERRCIVVGGGAAAASKVRGLLDADAAVTVISAEITEPLRRWADTGAITWIPRSYQPGDLRGIFLALVTDGDAHTRAQIWEEAQAERVLLNIEDDAARSTFVAGSVVRRGALAIAISTSGCAPALAVRLRQQLEQTLGPEYAAWLDLLRELRAPLAARYADFWERRERWYALIDSDVIDWLRRGNPDRARQRIAEIVGAEVAEAASMRGNRHQNTTAQTPEGKDTGL